LQPGGDHGIVNEALAWLDDVYQQLLEYDVDEVFASVIAPRPGYARIAAALQQSFHTTDLRYVEVIRGGSCSWHNCYAPAAASPLTAMVNFVRRVAPPSRPRM